MSKAKKVKDKAKHHAKKASSKAKSTASKSKAKVAQKTKTKRKSKKNTVTKDDAQKQDIGSLSNQPKAISAATVKINEAATTQRNISRSRRDLQSRKKAEYLSTLPKNPFRRILHRVSPKRFFKFMFSKRGAFMFLKLSAVGLLLMIVVVAAIFAYFRRDLDNLIPSLNSDFQEQTTTFYDRTGETVLYELFGEENRKVVELENISEYLQQATIAIEDKDFYDHNGFSIRGISRAAVNNFFGDGDGVQGGSTITQQFIKNRLLTDEQKITRKIRELILSVELELKYEKDQILELYLNEIAYGGQNYGIEAASLAYFGKSAADLTLDESAMLAALPQAPGAYSPHGGSSIDQLPIRQDKVLQNMIDQGYITQEEGETAMGIDTLAKVIPRGTNDSYANIQAPHLVLEVIKQLESKYGEQGIASGGLKVITTVDLSLQNKAEQAVSDHIWRVDSAGGDNAALTATDPRTGQVLAMAGSRNFGYEGFGEFNAATSRRQPGSTMKPYVYATLMKSPDWGAGSVFYDLKTNLDGFGYIPENNLGNYDGAMTMRHALTQSYNIPAIKAGYIAGVENVIAQAESQGLDIVDKDFYGMSTSIGTEEIRQVDHVNGYSTFANGGIQNENVYILEITNSRGEVIESWQPTQGERALDEQIAYIVTDMLKDLGPSYYVAGVDHAVKTGTTDFPNSRVGGAIKDGWMMGYSGCISAGVWIGHSENEPLFSSNGSGIITGPMWRQFMAEAHSGYDADCSLPSRPEGVQNVTLDRLTGKVPAGSSRAGTSNDLFPSWYKPAIEDNTQTATYDSVSGFLATSCTPPAAKVTYSSAGITAEIPPTDPLFEYWLSPIIGYAGSRGVPVANSNVTLKSDNVHKCSDVKPAVSITASQQSGNDYSIQVTATKGTFPLDSLSITADGQEIKSYNVSSTTTRTFNHTFTGSGTVTITALAIDKGLYNGSDSTSISLSAPTPPPTSPPFNITSSTAGAIAWTADSGASSYNVCYKEAVSGSSFTCISSSGTNTTISPLTTGSSYDVYVESLDSFSSVLNTTATVNFPT